MKKYIIYLRVSTKKQEASKLGLNAQRAIIDYYVNKEGGMVVEEFIETESGKQISNRPELQKAIKYCLEKKFTLIVAKLDRLSRDVEHIFKIKKQMGELFRSCDLPSSDSLTISIFAGLAQREREIISIRTKQALREKKKQGVVLGKVQNLTEEGRTLGVKRIKEKALSNENNRRATSLIVELRKKGMTYQIIAEYLNQHGFRSSKGLVFHKTTVMRLWKRSLL